MKKKTLFTLLLVVLLAVGVVGCGNKTTKETKKEEGKKFGWYSAVIPSGYDIDEYGEEFVKKDKEQSTLEYKIKVVLYDSGYGTAESRFKSDLEDSKFTEISDKKIGNFTWKRATFKWDNDLESVKYFAQIDDEYFVEIDSFNLGQDDKDVQSFIKSFKVLDGDCEDNKYELYNELNSKK